MNSGRHDETWLEAQRLIFDLLTSDKTIDWRDFAKRKFEKNGILITNNEIDENKISDAIRLVFNNHEFLSIAMKTEVVNEEIIKLAQENLFIATYEYLFDYIDVVRKIEKDDDIFINFKRIVEKWKGKPKEATPIN